MCLYVYLGVHLFSSVATAAAVASEHEYIDHEYYHSRKQLAASTVQLCVFVCMCACVSKKKRE